MDINPFLAGEIKAAIKNGPLNTDIIFKRCPSATDKVDLVKHLNAMTEAGDIDRDPITRAYRLAGELAAVLPVVDPAPAPAPTPASSIGAAHEQAAHNVATGDDLSKPVPAVVRAYLEALWPRGASSAELIAVFHQRSSASIHAALKFWRAKGIVQIAEKADGAPRSNVYLFNASAVLSELDHPLVQTPTPEQGESAAEPVAVASMIKAPGEDLQNLQKNLQTDSIIHFGRAEVAATDRQMKPDLYPSFGFGLKTCLVLTLEGKEVLELDPDEALALGDYVNANRAALQRFA